MKPHVENISPHDIKTNWLLDLIKAEFRDEGENITALKILSKLGVAIHNQTDQIRYNKIVQKLKATLVILHKKGALELKNSTHDTLGLKEKAYKLRILSSLYPE